MHPGVRRESCEGKYMLDVRGEDCGGERMWGCLGRAMRTNAFGGTWGRP